jgi:hypothetical protein
LLLLQKKKATFAAKNNFYIYSPPKHQNMRTSLPTPSLFLPTLLLCLLLSNALCGQTLTQKISQYNNQAISAYSQGDTLAALQWYYKELDATKQAYGEKDTLVAICYENIAQTYQALQVLIVHCKQLYKSSYSI